MNAEQLLRAVGEVDDALILEADRPLPRRKPAWQRYGAMAACAVLVIALGARVLPGSMGGGSAPSTASAGSASAQEARGDLYGNDGQEHSLAGPSSAEHQYSVSTPSNSEPKGSPTRVYLMGEGEQTFSIRLQTPVAQLPAGCEEIGMPDALAPEDPETSAAADNDAAVQVGAAHLRWFRSGDGTTYLLLDGQYYPVVLP